MDKVNKIAYCDQTYQHNVASNPFSIYQEINQKSIKQHEECYSLAFSSDNSIVIASCEKQIKVFEMKEGKLELSQILEGHIDQIKTLYFMRKTKGFISGSRDGSIRIWGINTGKWVCQQLLMAHSNIVFFIIMNKQEDLLISCSKDKTIKFWQFTNILELQQMIIGHRKWIQFMSLNSLSDLLLSCGNQQILIYKLCFDKKWRKHQIIQVQQEGFRIYFISDKQFLFQNYSGNQLQIFEMIDNKNLFQKKQNQYIEDIQSIYFSSEQVNQARKIILGKNDLSLHIISVVTFNILQTFNFGTQYVYGAFTDDANYNDRINFFLFSLKISCISNSYHGCMHQKMGN